MNYVISISLNESHYSYNDHNTVVLNKKNVVLPFSAPEVWVPTVNVLSTYNIYYKAEKF